MSRPQDLVSVKEAAKELGITPDAIRGAIARGTITPVRIDGRTNMLTREQVDSYCQERRGQRGKRPRPADALTEQQRKRQEYQRAYHQRRKAARTQQPAQSAESE